MRRLPALSEPQVKLDQPPAIVTAGVKGSAKLEKHQSGSFRNNVIED